MMRASLKKCVAALVTAYALFMTSFYTSSDDVIGGISQQQALPLNDSMTDGGCGR